MTDLSALNFTPAKSNMFGISLPSVSGLPPTQSVNTPDAPVAQAPDQATPAAGPQKHSGIHNVLSVLGDFLLEQTGLAPIIKNHRLTNALQGFDQDPSGAIERVSKIDPVYAAKLRDQSNDNQRLAAQQSSTAELRNARVATQNEAIRNGVKSRAASYFNNVVGKDAAETAANYARGRALWLHSAAVQADPQLQSDLNDLYPETFDPNTVASSVGATVPVSTQLTQQIAKQRIQAETDRADKRDDTARRSQDLTHEDRQAATHQSGSNAAMAADTADKNRAGADKRNKDRINAKPPVAAKAPKPTGADITYLRQNPAVRDDFDGRFGVGMSKRILGN